MGQRACWVKRLPSSGQRAPSHRLDATNVLLPRAHLVPCRVVREEVTGRPVGGAGADQITLSRVQNKVLAL